MTGRVGYVDGSAGLAGDMFLGALVDAGLEVAVIEDVVKALGLDGVTIHSERVMRGPLPNRRRSGSMSAAPASQIPAMTPITVSTPPPP